MEGSRNSDRVPEMLDECDDMYSNVCDRERDLVLLLNDAAAAKEEVEQIYKGVAIHRNS